LWILLTLFAVHESIVLAKRDIDYRGYALALINAWILAKVMLVAEDLDLGGRWFQHRPLIWQILSRAGILALVFMAAPIVESVLIGLWHRRTIFESIPRIGRIDGMKRLTPDSTWWHRVPHREITRSVAQREGGQPWTILASICTRGKARSASWPRAAS